MWWITEREKGGVIQPGDAFSKTRKPVLDVLWLKHPEACAPLAISPDAYPGRPPELFPVELTEEIFIEVVWHLSGGAIPEVTDSISLQHLLLRFGGSNGKFWNISAEFADWLSNERPPWAAYCALMPGRLIRLDKHPIIWHVGMVDT